MYSKNGRLHTIEDSFLVNKLYAIVNAGSMEEAIHLNGLAHVAEHVMLAHISKCQHDIKAAGVTNFDRTLFKISLPQTINSDHLTQTVQSIINLFENLTTDAEVLEKCKKQVIGECDLAREKEERLCKKYAILSDGKVTGMPVGNKHIINNIAISDIELFLSNYYNSCEFLFLTNGDYKLHTATKNLLLPSTSLFLSDKKEIPQQFLFQTTNSTYAYEYYLGICPSDTTVKEKMMKTVLILLLEMQANLLFQNQIRNICVSPLRINYEKYYISISLNMYERFNMTRAKSIVETLKGVAFSESSYKLVRDNLLQEMVKNEILREQNLLNGVVNNVLYGEPVCFAEDELKSVLLELDVHQINTYRSALLADADSTIKEYYI